MTRFIVYVSFMYFLSALALPYAASAKQIPNLSLSEQEMTTNPSITSNSTSSYGGYNTSYGNGNNPYAPENFKNLPYNGTNNAYMPKQSRYYMDGFCDENFTPLIANNPQYARLGDCIKQQKAQACAAFHQLPDDAKQVLDDTIACISKQANDDSLDGRSYYNAQGCTANDTMRIQMMRKYWREQNVVYALLFMPDDVADGSSRCMRGR